MYTRKVRMLLSRCSLVGKNFITTDEFTRRISLTESHGSSAV